MNKKSDATIDDDALKKQEYDKWHASLKGAKELANPLDLPWYKSVWNEIKNLPGGKLLEVGCGRGEFANWLAQMAPQFEITAIDFSETAIQIAKDAASGRNSVTFVQADAQALPFESNTFDIVVSCECMEHVPAPRKMAREIQRVLRGQGKFCLTTENYFNGMLIAWLHSLLTRKPFNSGTGVQPHENFFLFWIVRSYLRKAGLRIERMESCHYQWLLLPRVAPARLCTEYFESRWAKTLAFPFGRHMSYFGRKP